MRSPHDPSHVPPAALAWQTPAAVRVNLWRSRLLRLSLALSDVSAMVAAFWLASLLDRSDVFAAIRHRTVWDPKIFMAFGIGLGCLLVFVLAALGSYREKQSLLAVEEDAQLLRGFFLIAAIALALSFALRAQPLPRLALIVALFLAPFFALFGRLIIWSLNERLAAAGIGQETALIYGAGETGRRLAERIIRSPGLGLRVAGFIDDNLAPGHSVEIRRTPAVALPVLGDSSELNSQIAACGARAVFVAIPSLGEERLQIVQQICRESGTVCLHVPLFISGSLCRFEMALVGDMLLLQERPVIAAGIPWLMKRAFDLAIAIPLIILISPILLLAGLLIKISSPGPILFAQERLGMNGKIFTLYKLRTMAVDAPAYAAKEDAIAAGAVFAVGNFLRRVSIDELPQLWNVIRGEMSLVGPRPEMRSIAANYDRFQRERLRLPPGMTGLWQISASRNQPIHANLDYDLYYVYNRNFFLDLVILFRTIFCLGGGK